MVAKRRRYDAAFKAKVALEAIKGEVTISELSSRYQVHPNQISKWKKQLLEDLPSVFADGNRKREPESEELVRMLYEQIGQLKVELDWLKKKSKLLG